MSMKAIDYRNMSQDELDNTVMDEAWVKDHPQVVYDFSPCDLGDVTAVVASYRCLKLIQQTVETFKTFYPNVAMIVVDDTGQFGPDTATDYIKSLPDTYGNVGVIIHKQNMTHGPSLHDGIEAAKTRMVFTLDSDVIVKKAGLLEALKRRVDERGLLAAGPIYDSAYIATAATMWDRKRYLESPGLVKHSYPAFALLRWFYDNPAEFRAENCPVWEEYILHIGAGTRDRFYSARGLWNPSEPGAQELWMTGQAYRGRNQPELQD